MFDFTFDASSLEKLQAAMIAAPDIFEKEFLDAANEVGNLWYRDLATYAPPPETYQQETNDGKVLTLSVIRWDSSRQRRAFFLTNGFGRGIPHERNGRLPDSWDTAITTNPNMIKLEVFSTYGRAQYIQDSANQSMIHEGRWDNTVQNEAVETRETVNKIFTQAAERAMQRFRDKLK